MQMRTADCAGDDLDDDVAAILDLASGSVSHRLSFLPPARQMPGAKSIPEVWNDNEKQGLGIRTNGAQEIWYVR
jgi:hypothetical protein